MYRITCDGFPLMDLRDSDLMVVYPKVNLEVNTVGEGSFTIYKTHPHFDKLTQMRSVFEVSDDAGVIFRGRATGDTVDFDHGKHVDLEGAMAFFNDSLVRPFNFPDDFLTDSDYLTAAASGERVAFFIGWLIDNHNAQVQDFQRLKLGNVTVRDAEFARSSDEYASTWAMLKAKLFESTLGGYLCIRYEEDGNYIDYLAEFTETNHQEIAFGENLLDLSCDTEASQIFTAILPIGALGLTLSGLADGDVTADIVKSGDTLYSKRGLAEYGWIYASTSETTWEDVVDDADLLKAGVDWLTKGGSMLNAIEATAVDLHFTDEQVESLRIYKNVNVHSAPHGLAETFPLTRLELDLLNPQNTKIIVGKTIETFTEQAALLQEEAKKKYSRLSKSDEQIRMEVVNEIDDLSATFTMAFDEITQEVDGKINGEQAEALIKTALEGITMSVSNSEGSTTFKLFGGGAELTAETFDLHVKSVNIEGQLNVDQLNIAGAINFTDLDEETQLLIGDIYTMAEENQLPSYIQSTYIDSVSIQSPTIVAGTFIGNEFNAIAETPGNGSFNLYGKYGVYSVHALAIGYSAGTAPYITFSSPVGGMASWDFGATYFGGSVDMGQNDINFNVNGVVCSLRELESRITALETA